MAFASQLAPESVSSRPVFAAIRKLLFWALLAGLLGTTAELLLIGHTEDLLQWVPLVLMALLLPVLVWHFATPTAASVRALRIVMILFLAAGVAGLAAHWQSKLEFKRETNPSLEGFALFWEAMKSQSPPALAPGVFIQMALVGLAYAYRHPATYPQSGDQGEK